MQLEALLSTLILRDEALYSHLFTVRGKAQRSQRSVLGHSHRHNPGALPSMYVLHLGKRLQRSRDRLLEATCSAVFWSLVSHSGVLQGRVSVPYGASFHPNFISRNMSQPLASVVIYAVGELYNTYIQYL